MAACPVGAIGADGYFNFSACSTPNYWEFLTGFTDRLETIAESKSAREYRSHVSDAESVSMWQSLSFGANYNSAYCMAVCAAGFAALIAALTWREFPNLLAWVGMLLIIGGVSCLSHGSDNAGGGAQAAPAMKWRELLFGLSAACCWAISPIFTRKGLEGLPSPLLGVTVGLTASVLAYDLTLLFQRRLLAIAAIPHDIAPEISCQATETVKLLRMRSNLYAMGCGMPPSQQVDKAMPDDALSANE